jgi:DmsE family decaheme c-type cytochrome
MLGDRDRFGGMPAALAQWRLRATLRLLGVMTLSLALTIAVMALAALSLPANAADTGPAQPSAYSPAGADTCLACHGNAAVNGIFRTAHARPGDPRGPFGHGGLQCEACHGPGGAHVRARGRSMAGLIDFGPKAAASGAQQNGMCLGCHAADAAHDWASGAHAGSGISCVQCHQMHAPEDPVKSALGQTVVCTACHQAQRADLEKPSHHPLREGKMRCTSCHAPHGSTAAAQLVKNTVTETCTTCHAELRGPYLWEHQPVAEDCSTCHDAHGSVQPALLKARAPFLCQQCHEGAGHPSVASTPQGLASGVPSAFLLGASCLNCHAQIHGSNHPAGRALMR